MGHPLVPVLLAGNVVEAEGNQPGPQKEKIKIFIFLFLQAPSESAQLVQVG